MPTPTQDEAPSSDMFGEQTTPTQDEPAIILSPSYNGSAAGPASPSSSPSQSHGLVIPLFNLMLYRNCTICLIIPCLV